MMLACALCEGGQVSSWHGSVDQHGIMGSSAPVLTDALLCRFYWIQMQRRSAHGEHKAHPCNKDDG
jgi:hypothetical protein